MGDREVGRSEYSIASRPVCSLQCEMSMSIPTWFISLMTLRP